MAGAFLRNQKGFIFFPGGTADIRDFNGETLFDFERLDNSQAFNTRRNYYIII